MVWTNERFDSVFYGLRMFLLRIFIGIMFIIFPDFGIIFRRHVFIRFPNLRIIILSRFLCSIFPNLIVFDIRFNIWSFYINIILNHFISGLFHRHIFNARYVFHFSFQIWSVCNILF